ncbi:hypothetical protein BD408DRAFT_416815 [Parasitella parasitica]|nr:hypothetical protein BD408DRAFT_416815 [Parasitella parasitica]
MAVFHLGLSLYGLFLFAAYLLGAYFLCLGGMHRLLEQEMCPFAFAGCKPMAVFHLGLSLYGLSLFAAYLLGAYFFYAWEECNGFLSEWLNFMISYFFFS